MCFKANVKTQIDRRLARHHITVIYANTHTKKQTYIRATLNYCAVFLFRKSWLRSKQYYTIIGVCVCVCADSGIKDANARSSQKSKQINCHLIGACRNRLASSSVSSRGRAPCAREMSHTRTIVERGHSILIAHAHIKHQSARISVWTPLVE